MENNETNERLKLATELRTTKSLIDALSKQLEELKSEYNAKEVALVQLMIDNEESSFTDLDGNTYTLGSQLCASIKADVKIEAYEALKQSEFSSLVTETVNVRSLASVIKNWREEQGDPTGMVSKMPEVMMPYVNLYDRSIIKLSKKNK